MRCADIQADRDPDGQWISATAVFNGTVTGAVALVRAEKNNHDGHLFITFVLSITSASHVRMPDNNIAKSTKSLSSESPLKYVKYKNLLLNSQSIEPT